MCSKVHPRLTPGIDFPRFHARGATGYDPNKHSGNKFSREASVRTCDPYFPAARAHEKSIVSRTGSTYSIYLVFLIKSFPIRTNANVNIAACLSFLHTALISMRRHAFVERPTNISRARRLESDVYLFACWLVGGMDLFGCWVGLYQITCYFPTLSSHYI